MPAVAFADDTENRRRQQPICVKRPPGSRSGHQFGNDPGMLDTSELLVEPQMTVGESFMIKAQQVQHGGMEVTNVNRIFDDVVGKVISLTIDLAGAGTATTHPHGEAAGVMVAAIVLLGEAPLGIDRAAKFTAPDDQRVIKQAAGLEVLHEAITGLVDVTASIRQPASDVAVGIPVVEVDLHKPHAPFNHAAGHQNGVGKRSRVGHLISVEGQGAGRLTGNIG